MRLMRKQGRAEENRRMQLQQWSLAQRMLYFITPSVGKHITPSEIPQIVESAIKGGAGIIQWRQKPSQRDLLENLLLQEQWKNDATSPFLLAVAEEVRSITKKYQVPLIVNDSLELALRIDADGVHVGQSDTSLLDVQARLQREGKSFIIGVTVRDGAQAKTACEGGATYLGAGPVFLSSTKPNANDGHTIGIDGLRSCTEMAKKYNVPVYAIGGLALEDRRIQRCIEEGGATGVAVVAAISDGVDREAAATSIHNKLKELPQKVGGV